MKPLRHTIEQHLYEQEMQRVGYTISTICDEENDFYDIYTNKHGIIVNVVPNSNNSNPAAPDVARNLLKHTKGEHFNESFKNESVDLNEAEKISFPFAWGYLDSVLKDFKVHAKKAKLGLEPIQLDVVQRLIDKLRKEAYDKAEREFKRFGK